MEIAEKAYIDIHTHWLMFGKNTSAVVSELEWIETYGFEAIAIFPLPGMGASPEKMIDLIPGFLHEPMGLDIENAAHDDLKSWWKFQRFWMEKPHTLQLLSFLDVRAWNGQTDLEPWWGNGHTGLKGILIEEKDNAKMSMPPLRKVNGLSRADYREAQRAVSGRLPGSTTSCIHGCRTLRCPSDLPRRSEPAWRICNRVFARVPQSASEHPPLWFKPPGYE